MSDWPKILEAVKEPVSLAALSLLVLMVVLRQVINRLEPIPGTHGYKIARYTISVVGLLSFVVASGAIGYKVYELRTTSLYREDQLKTQATLEESKIAAAQAKPKLTRLDMENLLQRHRGSIEDCLRHGGAIFYYLDFVVENRTDGQLNIDVFGGVKTGYALMHPYAVAPGITKKDPLSGDELLPGEMRPKGDTYFVNGNTPSVVTAASSKKLSVFAPDVNICVLEIIKDSISTYSPPADPFVHRLITDAGVRASRSHR